MTESNKLRNLEGAILGAIAMREPCTAYRVHRNFANSPSQYFSGSAGAVYPAFNRLEKRGLIKAKSVGTDLRPAKGFVLTRKGKEDLKIWFHDPILAGDGGFDPLRLRFSFLTALPPHERGDFVKKMGEAIAARLKKVNKFLSEWPENSTGSLAAKLEKAALEAKIKALKEWQKAGVVFSDVIEFNASE
ncbi:MAG: PadR family transcriptional regulator [Alphaproteobacteria bacterium]